MDRSTYYGNPNDSYVNTRVNLASATLDHRVGGLSIRNRTLIADYRRSYQNYVPGAVSADQSTVTLTSYNNATDRRNIFNQTDLTYSLTSGGLKHTLLAGAEVGRQLTDNFRNTGFFNNATTSVLVPYGAPTIRPDGRGGVRVAHPDPRLQANLENLFDTAYVINADSNTNISPGSPRAMRVALTARF